MNRQVGQETVHIAHSALARIVPASPTTYHTEALARFDRRETTAASLGSEPDLDRAQTDRRKAEQEWQVCRAETGHVVGIAVIFEAVFQVAPSSTFDHGRSEPTAKRRGSECDAHACSSEPT